MSSYHAREVRATQRPSSTGGEEVGFTLTKAESADASAQADGYRERTLAGGASLVRLDPWGGGTGVELATIRHIDFKCSAAVDVRVGTSATEAIRVTPRGTRGYFGADVNITRSATVGIFLTNPSSPAADLTIEFMLS